MTFTVLYKTLAPGDRGVPWLVHCRKGWRFKPLKYSCTINCSVLSEATDPDYQFLYIDISSVDSNGCWMASEPICFENAPSRARRVVREGDVLISTVRTYLRAITYLPRVDGFVICSTGFAVLTSGQSVFPGFLAYWVRSSFFIDEIVARSVGVSYPAINAADIGNLPFPCIPYGEQSAIAAFLDRETARIDALIEKKQRQIELLQEKRAALISHVVTKGLNPNVKMRDSGIEWLGEIPEHWGVMRLKRLARLRSGNSITSSEIEPNGDYPVYGGNGLRGYASSYTHNGQFILIGRQGALCGCINYAQGRFWASEHAVVLTPIKEIATIWLGELLRSMNLNQYSQSAAQPGLAVETIAAICLPVPPVADQNNISTHLSNTSSRIDAIIQKISKSVSLLHEYRTALISAAVTGNIEVSTGFRPSLEGEA